MCTLAATKRRYDTRYPTPATQFTDNFVEKNEVPSYFSRILRFSSSLFVEYNKVLCAVCTFLFNGNCAVYSNKYNQPYMSFRA